MDTKTAKRVEKLLEARCDRIERASIDSGGVCVTAHWVDGGQRVFSSGKEVADWVEDRTGVRPDLDD